MREEERARGRRAPGIPQARQRRTGVDLTHKVGDRSGIDPSTNVAGLVTLLFEEYAKLPIPLSRLFAFALQYVGPLMDYICKGL